ncbi:hypothetical protein K439DRAFT_1613971 [Ramaria rubella]|nr:hypothetical protein K439DRAFT_1613971 [Ramaria rubella]
MPNNVRIDPSAFLSSIKYEDEHGDACSVEPWRVGELMVNMSAEQRKEYAEAWDIVDKHTASTSQHKKAHKHDKTFHRLAHYKGHAYKDCFHCPKNHQGFNDNSDEEVDEPDIFGDEDINQDNSNVTGNKKPKKRKAKQGKKGNKTRKGDNNCEQTFIMFSVITLTTEPINVGYESDVDMDAVVYVTSTTDSSEADNEASEDNEDNDDNKHETRHISSAQEHMPTNSSGFMTQQLKENDGLKESNLTPFEVSLSYANIQRACEQLALDIKRIEGIPTTNKDINDPLTIHNARMYSGTVDMQKNPFEHQTLQIIARTWLKVKHAKANSAKDNIQERINRQHAMVAHGFAWDWVERACVTEIKAIMTEPCNSRMPWIANLIHKVQSFIEVHFPINFAIHRSKS